MRQTSHPEAQPGLSIIVGFRNMAREAPRTLFTLSAAYQRDVAPADYEVIAVDVGSSPPLAEDMVRAHGPQFRLLRFPDAPSPAAAINAAAAEARGSAIALAIDGARMLSPRVLALTRRALAAYEDPVVATLAWHLGPRLQNLSMLEGYDQSAEDALLDGVDWRTDGYELFRIASLAHSSRRGWSAAPGESNFVTVRREAWHRLGGLDTGFRAPGGGMLNNDYFRRACLALGQLVLLLGEGTFHQFHGGIATNVPMDRHPSASFMDEYVRLRGEEFVRPAVDVEFIGSIPPQIRPFIAATLQAALNGPIP